jgi:hypothetical protein
MIDAYIATWARPLGKLYVHNIKYTKTRTLEKYKSYDSCYILPLSYTLYLSIANRELGTPF